MSVTLTQHGTTCQGHGDEWLTPTSTPRMVTHLALSLADGAGDDSCFTGTLQPGLDTIGDSRQMGIPVGHE